MWESQVFAKGLFNISAKITPMWLTQIRLIISGIVLLLLAGALKQKPIATLKNKHDALVLLLMAFSDYYRAIILFHVYSGS